MSESFWQGFFRAAAVGAVVGIMAWLAVVVSELLASVQSWWRR